MHPVAVGLLAGRLALALVFLLAGVAKFADRGGTGRALIGFGVPRRLASPAGTLLPVAEFLVAIALLPIATARWGAVAALVFLAVFTCAIALMLARGNAPACRCFGRLAATPVGPRTLVRNGILLAVAAFLAVVGWHSFGPSLLSPIAALSYGGELVAAGTFGLLLLCGAVVLVIRARTRRTGPGR